VNSATLYDVTVALAGRPNSGKSSIYNALTGGNAHVGNYPGITVDVTEGRVTLPSGRLCRVADLPGFYSIETTLDRATDEGVARSFLETMRTEQRSLVVLQVIDATRLALGLRLTAELRATGLPLAIALTHRDVLEREGRAIDLDALRQALGVPIVLIDTRAPDTRDTLTAAVEQALDLRVDRTTAAFDASELSRRVINDVATLAQRNQRAVTERLDRYALHPALGPILFLAVMTLVFAAVFLIADPAASFADALINTLARPRIRALLGESRFSSFVTDGVLGGAGTVIAFMPQIVTLTVALELLEASGYLARGSFLVDRILRLLGLSGRSFVPLLMGNACAIPAIAATRVIRDPRERLTTMLVLPLMTCSARLPTYGLVLGTFFSGRSVFFRSGIFVCLYFASIGATLAASAVLRRTATRGKGLPLVLEMPAYRMPMPRVVARKAWLSARRFARDVGTVIVGFSAVLWVLLTIPAPGTATPADANASAVQGPSITVASASTPTSAGVLAETEAPSATGIHRSIAAAIGRAAEPVTLAAGFDWRINVGLIGSFGARELMVGTLGVIFGIEDAADDPAPLTERLRTAKSPDGRFAYTTATGLALLAFFVIACQCMSTLAAIRRETGTWKWPAFVALYTYFLGYAVAVGVYRFASLFTNV